MKYGRVTYHPVLGTLDKRESLRFLFDDQEFEAYKGETIAAALLANGVRTLRRHEETGTPRGIYCNIGHCFECRVTIDGITGQRACLTVLKDGMNIRSGEMLPTPLKKGAH
ncbi:(2Fe-2S)-binding protein [Paenibacillus sp. KQZ6P-2]|uniref:(2Fe-2S)-binding protein n=1 Tax=Paenibacillus mangrovi TaxID=2931978 RepID=A0A9X2B3I8_9BACL|nr:(2Fe-2S)-binding protein [Paenibacillus mangrovi]MCJ8013471.1 (2Fe-2S)-binding protein [Paenibacillus mangrovi]